MVHNDDVVDLHICHAILSQVVHLKIIILCMRLQISVKITSTLSLLFVFAFQIFSKNVWYCYYLFAFAVNMQKNWEQLRTNMILLLSICTSNIAENMFKKKNGWYWDSNPVSGTCDSGGRTSRLWEDIEHMLPIFQFVYTAKPY